jgi:cytochrome P450
MNQYVHDIQDAANTGRLAIPFPTITRLLSQTPLVRFTKVYASVQRMGSYARESIARYEKIMNSEPDKAKVTMLTKVFNAAADKNEETMSFPELESIAEAYIIAGSDTTAHSLTYLTWAVCGNPSIKEKLAEEVAGLPETYNNDDLKALPYLNQVIHETLRLYAAVPALLPREVGTAGCEIDGYWMPGGTEVQTQAYSMHRNPTVFSNPEQFDPPRWENPTKDMKDAWMPFGGGARSKYQHLAVRPITDNSTACGGLHLALMEIRYATARFFRTFPNAKVSSKYGFTDDDMEQIIYFLMFPKNNRCLIEVS